MWEPSIANSALLSGHQTFQMLELSELDTSEHVPYVAGSCGGCGGESGGCGGCDGVVPAQKLTVLPEPPKSSVYVSPVQPGADHSARFQPSSYWSCMASVHSPGGTACAVA